MCVSSGKIPKGWTPGDGLVVVEDGVIKAGVKKRVVEIPNGWRIVAFGKSQRWDKYLYAGDLYERVVWRRCDEDELGDPFDFFAVLIREEKRFK